MTVDYFPLSTARGTAFCNRTNELAHLCNNIDFTRPTLIMSPRRYGKTSLALRTLNKAKIIFAHVDLYKELSSHDVAQAIINGVSEILSKIEDKPKQLLRLAADFFNDLHINFTLGNLGLRVELSKQQKPADKIQEVLKKLNILLKTKKIKAALYIDEFQKLADITGHTAIEAAIRHEAQLTDNIFYLFSGSNRHLIENMFFDSNRPFYKLCDTIYLQRISSDHYHNYINHAAVIKWQQQLEPATIDLILELTQNHSYYVNLLCFKLWLADKLPDEKTVRRTWHQCVLENKSLIEKELDLLSPNQKKLIIFLSKLEPTKAPTGREFISQVNMSSTSVAQALQSLLDKDYVYKDADGYYKLLDPMHSYLFSDQFVALL